MLEVIGYVAIGAVVLLGGFYAGKWLFRKDEEIEDRRRGAAKLAGVLRQYGLIKIPEFLIDYSVGDYSGMTEKIADTARIFLDGEAAVVREFERIFDNVLAAKLKTEEGRALVAAKLEEAVNQYEVIAEDE